MKNKDLKEKDDLEEEDSLQCTSKCIDSEERNSLSKDFLPKKEPDHILVLSISGRNSCIKQWFFQKLYGLDNKIPKHIISFDEKYLRRCLEWMHISAFGAPSCNFSSMGVFPNYLSSRGISSRRTYDMARSVFQRPLAPLTDCDAISSAGEWILGTISASKSMINILRSPLLHQLGALDSNVSIGGKGLLDVKEAIASDFISSPGKFGTSKPKKLKEFVLGDHEYVPEPVHKRVASVSSANSTCSDQSSSSSASAAICQGMLQCTWKDGHPNYLFSVDDQGEVYAANLLKIQSPEDKALDYIYTFHLKSGHKREHDIRDRELDLVAKMKVSTSITLGCKNSEIMETQFVLFGSSESWMQETQTSVHALKKNKGLTKKVADVFRTSQSRKQRTFSKFWGTSIILEDTSWESLDDACDNLDYSSINHAENDIPPNLELATVVVKDHISCKPKEPEIGGWGLKFLKKSGNSQTNAISETSVVSECCQRDGGECSTSMKILVPAGFHGGPRARKGGPSSLLERWRTGGHCDCGGWDIGCPLTVINTRTNRMESLPQADQSGECKTVDLFVEGSQQIAPIMKMTNIHQDLYYIHFQSTLSALQSFSIATAIIHSNSPALRPQLYRS